METFYRTHSYLVEHTNAPVRRDLMDEIDWNDRLIGIKGTRGVGKTTFLLQYAKEKFGTDHSCLFINMNNFYFSKYTLVEFAAEFVKRGGKVLLIDQVFKYPEWSHDLRACYEMFPTLKIIFTGSSVMRLKEENPELSGIVTASFPFASFELSDQKGIFLGLNLYNRSPVFIDLYDDYKYTNGNFAAFGNSGAGKSTLLQSIGKRLREQQRKVIYIVPEKGHEYRPLCEAVGGQFIKLGPSSPDCIGLMDIRRLKASPYAAQNGGTQRRESLLAEKVSWLSVWYSLQKRNLSEEDMNYIDASLIECYGRRGITFDNASLFEEDGVTIKEMPVIQEWYDILREKQETKHLSVILTRYVSGSAASMGGHTNVDTENPYIVIDLTDIPDDLQLATVYAATGFATDITVQNGDVGTALLSDELWKLLGANSNPLAADYTMRMVKLIRSQGARRWQRCSSLPVPRLQDPLRFWNNRRRCLPCPVTGLCLAVRNQVHWSL